MPRGDHIDTGYGTGVNFNSFLTLPTFSVVYPGSLQFRYDLVYWYVRHLAVLLFLSFFLLKASLVALVAL